MAIYESDRTFFARVIIKDFLEKNADCENVETAMAIIKAVDTILNCEEQK